jgi:Reverse transcriptase (RNA-dependent DNA polymerase)
MVMCFEMLRIVLSTAVSQGTMICQFNVTSAYLHHPLREVVYMKSPPGFAHPSDPKFVWHLLKPLYSMVQGGHYWEEEKTEFMQKNGWKKLASDPSAFRKMWEARVSAVAVFWVDDAVCAGPKEKLLELEHQFSDRYGISSEGELTWMLGIAFKGNHANQTIELSQISFIDSMLCKLSLDNAMPVATPFIPGAYLTATMSPRDDLEHEEMK